MAIIRTSYQIRSADFLRDVKHLLRPLIDGVKLGHLDEAVARGFGFPNRTAALDTLKTRPVTVEVNDAAFRARLAEFGGKVASGMFAWNVHEAVVDAGTRGSDIVQAIINGEPATLVRESALRILRDADGSAVPSFAEGLPIKGDEMLDDDGITAEVRDPLAPEVIYEDEDLSTSWEHMQTSRGWR
ncbi:hypothetical protein ABNQ38_14605 (plasmid) [Azospirillum sp. A29]|uniref:hypothetical protein n=1 Tax=Azospirillum sp. A29 TaxID=3160606 RepID=UPI003671D20A